MLAEDPVDLSTSKDAELYVLELCGDSPEKSILPDYHSESNKRNEIDNLEPFEGTGYAIRTESQVYSGKK